MADPLKPGVLERLRSRYRWFDHLMHANELYNERKGNFYAAGLTYYTIFALFPLLMVGFAVIGFLLSRQPDLLAQIDDRIRTEVSGSFAKQLIKLVNSAIAARGSVGVVGLAAAAWAGLSWMANLRAALSEMWAQRAAPAGFLRTKMSDLGAMVSAFAAIAVTIALTALAGAAPMAKLLSWFGIHSQPVLDGILRGVSVMVSLLLSWLVFTWMIARLPRESVSFASSIRAGLLAAIAFEVFKQIASIYLRVVLRSPASAAFGPVLGLMVFVYITARLVLFVTAWAATSPDNLRSAPVQPLGPAIDTRMPAGDGLRADRASTVAAVTAIVAVGLWRLISRRHRR